MPWNADCDRMMNRAEFRGGGSSSIMANDQQHTDLEQLEGNEMDLEQVKSQLIELGKKRGTLTYKEIMDKLGPYDQDPEQIDEFFEQLSDLSIEVLNESDEEDIDLDDEDEEEDFDLDDDLSLPPGVKINDPVRMYLKETGKMPLLTTQ